MKRKIIIAVLLLLFIAAFFLAIKTTERYAQNQDIAQNKQSLPNFRLYDQNLKPFWGKDISTGDVVCIFYYNAECEHCQYEATQISQNIDKFKRVQVLMVSTNTPTETKTFANSYKLSQYHFITWLYDKNDNFYKWFGASVTPSLYIYNGAHKLIKEHTGELKIDAILKYLNDAKKG